MPHPARIACFIYTGSTFWSMLAHGLAARAAEFSAEVEVLSAVDVDGQDAALAEVVRQRFDALVLGVIDPVRGAASARAAQAAGIPAIAVVAELPADAVRTNVRVDDSGGALLGAEFLARRLGGRGPVAHFYGARNVRTAHSRAAGFHKVMARHPAIEVVYEGEGPDWSYESGQRLMREALAVCPRLAGLFAASDSMALGAAAVLGEAGRAGEVTIVGFDGQPEALVAVNSGQIHATVDQPAYTIGRAAGDAVEWVLRGEQVAPEIVIPSRLISQENLADAALATIGVMPSLFQSLLTSAETQRRLQEEKIAAQRALIQELSAPILPLDDDIVAIPLVGAIDSQRAARITALLLETIGRTRARTVIMDISGVPVVDTGVANHLISAAAAARLLGSTVVLVGISPEIAQTMVQLGIDLSGISTFSSLRDGLRFAQSRDQGAALALQRGAPPKLGR